MLPSLGLVLALAPAAHAYPWLIQHGYSACAGCHVDPAGGGTLTAYGRSLGAVLLASHGAVAPGTDPGAAKDFAFGAIPLPKAVQLQADVRALAFPQPVRQPDDSLDWSVRAILMQADLRGAVDSGRLVAGGSVGVVSEGAQGAWLTSNAAGGNLVSREYWAGVRPNKATLVRAGRLPLPFGLRTEEHTLQVRSATRTSMNADQQAGVSVFHGRRRWRAEAMAILGNPQVAPAAYRETGYAAQAFWTPSRTVEIGASSLRAASERDVETLEPGVRQAHGVHARWAPLPHTAVLAEADALRTTSGGVARDGVAAVAEVDWEPTQGVHLRGIGQFCDTDLDDSTTGATTAWLAAQWFLLPRVDLRVDALHGTLRCGASDDARTMALAQIHAYL
ncbi:MAG: hypothetical protein RLZZ299_1478 [Pseudomonadota bacterium]